MKTVEVNVTREDIDLGERQECTKCPIARAICRLVKADTLVEVGEVVTLINGPKTWTLDMPEIADEFVESFDDDSAADTGEDEETTFAASSTFAPFKFNLELPEEVLR